MSQLLNLSITDHRKLIVVDEGIDATYSEYFITAWLQVIRKKKIEYPIDILLFSMPQYRLDKYLQSSEITNYQIHDYFHCNLDNKEVDAYERVTSFVAERSNSIFVVDCLGTLALQIGIAKACRFIEKLSNSHKFEIFCIYRRDFYQIIPRIETLGNVYVKLKKSKKVGFGSNIYYEISVTHKKAGGSIIQWNELIQQNIETYDLVLEKIIDNLNVKTEKMSQKATAKPQASFRLEMNEREIKQRDSVTLPYIKTDNNERESKIFYVPDDIDSDEEDPDDDLDI